MPHLGTVLVFAVATLVLVATPGPGLLYLVGRAAAEGRRAGFASMFGVEAAEVAYIIGAAVGLSALLAHSTVALSALRYFGAAYLILLGVRRWRRPDDDGQEMGTHSRHAFAQGFVVQLMNPKVALFFVAYFPQFLRPGEPVAPQVLVLGAVYVLVALASDTTYVLLTSSIAARYGRTAAAARRRSRIGALVYLALGIGAALAGDRHTSGRALGGMARRSPALTGV